METLLFALSNSPTRKPSRLLRAWRQLALVLLASALSFPGLAQTPTPGLIFKPATAGTPGSAVLDPNNDGYVSATAAGFTGTDLGAASELPYRFLPQIVAPREPMMDLRVGPSTKFTDFADYAAPNGGNSVGFYVDGNNNYMFRFRLGGAAPNSKGYSIAVDTDGKFGFSGPDADPNAVLGNPGFELEILLASNFGVRLYNLDGTATPSDPGLVGGGGPDGSMVELPYDSYAHKAIAFTANDNSLDVFYDFYIPMSVIQAEFGPRTFFGTSGTATAFSLATPLRMVANTIIAPHSVTKYQNISDISGLANVPNTDNGFISIIGGSTATSGGSLPPGNNIPARTATPAVNCPVQKGATTISGTSTEIGATITVYYNGVAQTTTPASIVVSGGGTWSATVPAVPSGALVTATALAAGKSLSAVSSACQASIAGQSACATPAPPAVFCASDKNIGGEAPTDALVYLRRTDGTLVPARNASITQGQITTNPEPGSPQDPSSAVLFNPVRALAANNTPNGFTAAPGNSWYQFTSAGGNIGSCQSGQTNAFTGVYLISVIASGTTCESAGTQVCVGTGTAAAPTNVTAPISTTTTAITGNTATSGATVVLYVDGSAFSQVTSVVSGPANVFSFTGASLPALTLGRVLTFRVNTATACQSADVTRTVVNNRTVIAPIVNGPLYPGTTTVAGTSVEAPGSVITVTTFTGLNATGTPTTLTTTTTVQTDGSWSLTVPALGSNTSVRATVTPVDYGQSGPSNVVNVVPRTTFVPTITGTYTEGNTVVTGTVPANTPIGTVLTVYIDGAPLTGPDGVTPLTVTTTSTSATGTTAWQLNLPASQYPALYAGGILTATATAPNQAESVFSNQVPVGCVTFQNRTLNTAAICVGNTATLTVANVEAGVIYTLQDATSGANLAPSKLGPGTGTSSITFTTAPYTTAGTFPLRLNAFSLGAIECSATAGTASLTVNPLPLARPVAAQNPTLTTYQAALTGTNITVQSSQAGVSYQLVNITDSPNVNIGAPQNGNGGTLTFPTGRMATNRTSTTYSVVGTSVPGCTQTVGTQRVDYAGPLPVELTSFEAKAVGTGAVLTWRTASEKNSARFVVERSRDGQTFAAVATVEAQGNSAQPTLYQAIDRAAAAQGLLLYYRLQQVDLDGTAAFSPVLAVKFAGAAASEAALYPNPSTGRATLNLATLPAGRYTVSLVNATGQTVRTQQLAAGLEHVLDLSALPRGLYVVRITGVLLHQALRLTKE